MLDIYGEELISRYEHPHEKGKLDNASISMHEENVSCGDTITIYLKIKDDRVEDAKFDGNGCIISMGSADLLLEEIKGKSLSEIEKMGKEDLFKIIGIEPGPARLHCATLSLRALKKAVLAFENKEVDRETKEL